MVCIEWYKSKHCFLVQQIHQFHPQRKHCCLGRTLHEVTALNLNVHSSLYSINWLSEGLFYGDVIDKSIDN